MIEPLRPKFIQKLKNQSYICKKCGNAFTPAQNEICYYHQYETAIKCNDFEDNVSFTFLAPIELVLKFRILSKTLAATFKPICSGFVFFSCLFSKVWTDLGV